MNVAISPLFLYTKYAIEVPLAQENIRSYHYKMISMALVFQIVIVIGLFLRLIIKSAERLRVKKSCRKEIKASVENILFNTRKRMRILKEKLSQAERFTVRSENEMRHLIKIPKQVADLIRSRGLKTMRQLNEETSESVTLHCNNEGYESMIIINGHKDGAYKILKEVITKTSSKISYQMDQEREKWLSLLH